MICEKIKNGLQIDCSPIAKKYYQQAVIVNREDINNKQILTSTSEGCRHRVFFDLKEGKTGYRFSINENSESIFGSFNKQTTDNQPQYSHNVNIVITGVSEATKCLLKQLDLADYFAALQYYDGTVEIFGFEYGLSTSDYGYNPQGGGGGSIIGLKSLSDSLEDEPPFVYGGSPLDFDNNFSDVDFEPKGDFNDDFNDDFNNQP